MRQATFRLTVGSRLGRAAVVCLLVAAASAHASAQTRAAETPSPSPQQPTQRAGATADEDFELNIDQRRINEGEYHAETAVSTEGARGLRLNVGVALSASEIDVLLRNVRGRVRFRASLDPVLRLLDALRVASPQSQPAPAPP